MMFRGLVQDRAACLNAYGASLSHFQGVLGVDMKMSLMMGRMSLSVYSYIPIPLRAYLRGIESPYMHDTSAFVEFLKPLY